MKLPTEPITMKSYIVCNACGETVTDDWGACGRCGWRPKEDDEILRRTFYYDADARRVVKKDNRWTLLSEAGSVQVTVRHPWGEETYTVPGIWQKSPVTEAAEMVTVSLKGVPIQRRDEYRIHGTDRWYTWHG